MKTQTYIVRIEMPEGDMIPPTWLKDLIQSDCDVEDSGRQIVSVNEIIEPQVLDEAAEKAGWGWACKNKLDPYSMGQAYSEGHKAGAKWMAEQGESKETGVFRYNQDALFVLMFLKDDTQFKLGDKVIVQIRKEE